MYSKPTHLFLILIVVLLSCSKSSDAPKPEGSGKFTFQSTEYSGKCTMATASANSASINVAIAGTTSNFIVYNMPKTSSGSTAFTDGFSNIDSPSALYAFLTISPMYATAAGGSVTKTGANTFTFTCQVYYILDASTKYTVTGSGTYY